VARRNEEKASASVERCNVGAIGCKHHEDLVTWTWMESAREVECYVSENIEGYDKEEGAAIVV
jgi:hypothetical protein